MKIKNILYAYRRQILVARPLDTSGAASAVVSPRRDARAARPVPAGASTHLHQEQFNNSLAGVYSNASSSAEAPQLIEIYLKA
jgi:hypothetical protein